MANSIGYKGKNSNHELKLKEIYFKFTIIDCTTDNIFNTFDQKQNVLTRKSFVKNRAP